MEYPVYQPHNGWSEQDPDDWYEAGVTTIRYCLDISGVAGEDVAAIGIAGQMMGAVLLDSKGQPLRRAILWNDARTSEAAESVRKLIGDDTMMRINCNPVRPGLTAAKIQWVKENEPEIWAKTAHILLPKDYLRYRLTGEYATEVSDASAMQLLDVRNRCWSPELLAAMEIKESQLGKMYESTDVTGQLTKDVAGLLGLLLQASGFIATKSGETVVQPGSALMMIRLLYSAIPALVLLATIFAAKHFDGLGRKLKEANGAENTAKE